MDSIKLYKSFREWNLLKQLLVKINKINTALRSNQIDDEQIKKVN
jgi:hypothetical protein